MKFSNNWVRQRCQTKLSAQEIADTITMAGLEVDACLPVAGDFNQVVVGTVKSCSKHPNADKLCMTIVDVGEAEDLAIVCGAPNCREGLRVAVAKVGATLPGGFKIKASKIRGEMSFGMLCSTNELGLADESKGIWELPTDAPVGTDLRQYLDLDDVIIDVDLTPNRADCFSIHGIAREIGALTGSVTNSIMNQKMIPAHEQTISVDVQAPQACPRYLTRVITQLRVDAKTPIWMQEKLRRSGIRAVSPVVDILQYVMLELGQPMHAFDLACIDGCLQVRYAQSGEQLTLLDGQTISLQENTLIIADMSQPLAIAGILGGQDSGVHSQTTDIVLESAFFSPLAIVNRARQYGLHTDASMRFERGVDFELQYEAIERATALILDICGGFAGAIQQVVSENDLPKKVQIILRYGRLIKLLGIEIPAQDVSSMLIRLGMQVEPHEQGWCVITPSWRFDLQNEVDLIEEVARVYGYNNIPGVLPRVTLTMPKTKEMQVTPIQLKARLMDSGFQEIITYSFTDPKQQSLLFPKIQGLMLKEPISQDMSVMRISLWPGLLQATNYNLNRQQNVIRLFELGVCFVPDTKQESGICEVMRLGGLMTGLRHCEHWATENKPVDFFDLKGAVEELLDSLGLRESVHYVRHDCDGILHPGQSAAILNQDKIIGYLGALHPRLHKNFGVKQPVYLFEFDVMAISEKPPIKAQILSKFPSIRRDLAIVVDQEIPLQDVLECVQQAGGNQLVDVNLFDIYQGETIATNKKSLALSLTLQSLDKTLVDQDVNTIIQAVVAQLQERLNASLRE